MYLSLLFSPFFYFRTLLQCAITRINLWNMEDLVQRGSSWDNSVTTCGFTNLCSRVVMMEFGLGFVIIWSKKHECPLIRNTLSASSFGGKFLHIFLTGSCVVWAWSRFVFWSGWSMLLLIRWWQNKEMSLDEIWLDRIQPNAVFWAIGACGPPWIISSVIT